MTNSHLTHQDIWDNNHHHYHRASSFSNDSVSSEKDYLISSNKVSYSSISSPSISSYKSLSTSSPNKDAYYYKEASKKLSILSLAVLIFYEVSGGPFGMEDIVRAGGPLFALLGFSLVFVWAIPEALITAELSTALPEASGSIAWVDVAFGPFWAFHKGWLSLLSGISDNALYPILFIDCFVKLFQESDMKEDLGKDIKESSFYESISRFALQLSSDYDSSGLWISPRFLVILIITISLTYLNYRGLEIVGKLLIAICFVSMLPFLLFCCIGVFKMDPKKLIVMPVNGISGVNWRLFLNSFFWNINYWESAACFSNEIHEPEKNFPKSMFLAILLVFFTGFFPILVGLGASDKSWTLWTDGYFVSLAKEIVGNWLSYWLIISSFLTNISMFLAEMSSDSWQIAGMSDRGILPSILGYRNEYNTPTYGILISSMGIISICWLSFNDIIDMLNLLYCIGQLIEFLAFIYLRFYHPSLNRPYKIPLNNFGIVLMLFFPIVFILIILYHSSFLALLLCVFLNIVGVLVYYLLEITKKGNMLLYEDRCKESQSISSGSIQLDDFLQSNSYNSIENEFLNNDIEEVNDILYDFESSERIIKENMGDYS